MVATNLNRVRGGGLIDRVVLDTNPVRFYPQAIVRIVVDEIVENLITGTSRDADIVSVDLVADDRACRGTALNTDVAVVEDAIAANRGITRIDSAVVVIHDVVSDGCVRCRDPIADGPMIALVRMRHV